jgi:hypothetical protein
MNVFVLRKPPDDLEAVLAAMDRVLIGVAGLHTMLLTI